nr:T9SS type A sorting domain-containing protein [uncultured Brumimicrobium sp.]
MKKRNIFSAAIMAAGLFVSSFAQAQSCDTLRNYTVPANNTYTLWSSSNGLILGQDQVNDGTDNYNTDVWAEPYNIGTSSSQIRAVRMLPWKIQNNSGTASLTVQVYNDNAGEPGTVIGSQVVDYDDLNAEMVWSTIEFDTPVSVTGSFFVGYELSFVSPVDSFALATTQPATNFTMFHLSGPIGSMFNDQWMALSDVYSSGGNPINSAFAFDVLLSTGTIPVPDFSAGNTEACLSGAFTNLDGSLSTGTIDGYRWWLTDNPVTQILASSTGINTSLSPTTATPTTQRIILWTDGACLTRGAYADVIVNPDITATVTKTDALCGNSNGGIAITNTSGGSGTYLYSVDGGTNTSPTPNFSNLAAGTYDVTITSNGDGCSYAETITITDTPGEILSVGGGQTICAGSSANLTASGNGTIEWFEGATSIGTGATMSVSPTATTTYDVVLTDANGCTDTDQITVTVTPLADASFAYSSNTICLGGSNETPTVTTAGGTFSASGAGLVISATNGEIDMSASTAGTYDVTYTISGTCGNSEVQSITITNSPDASFSYSATEFCQNEGAVMPTFPTGASGGTFTSTTGLTIASGTGSVDLASSTPGVYVVTNTIAASGSCAASSETFSITVKETPTVDAGADQAVCEGTDVTLTATGADTYAWNNGITQGTPFTPGVGTLIYTVTGTGVNGCENTDQVSVVVTANPTVNAGADQAVCEGAEVTLTAASTGGTVTWDNGVTDGTPFTPTTTTTYTVSVDNNGCTATDEVVVTVNPLPTVDAGADQTACTNHSAIALAGTPAGGTFSGNGVSNNEFDPATAGVGTHTVTYTYADGNGCENTATLTVTVDGCVSVEENVMNQLTVSPNPSSDYIEVRVNENNSIQNIQVMSLDGKVVSVEQNVVDHATIKIDVSSVAKGTYLIQLSTEYGFLTRKIVVQ